MEGTEKQDHRPSPVSLMQGEPLWFTSKSKGTEWLSSWLKIDEPQQNTSSHLKEISEKKKKLIGSSLMVQWLRMQWSMQETQVRLLVHEDPTCLRATKPLGHSY